MCVPTSTAHGCRPLATWYSRPSCGTEKKTDTPASRGHSEECSGLRGGEAGRGGEVLPGAEEVSGGESSAG